MGDMQRTTIPSDGDRQKGSELMSATSFWQAFSVGICASLVAIIGITLAFDWNKGRIACTAETMQHGSLLTRGAGAVELKSMSTLSSHDFGRPGLSHVSIWSHHKHKMSEVEIWQQTFAAGVKTPIHRHDCEEVFIVTAGAKSNATSSLNDVRVEWRENVSEQNFEMKAQQDSHFIVHTSRILLLNDTFVIRPNVAHRIINNGKEDVSLLVIFSKPPIDVYVYESWQSRDSETSRVFPYYFDRQGSQLET